MLAEAEDVSIPLAQLEAAGRADLQRNRAALVAACQQYAPGATVPACVQKMNADKPPAVRSRRRDAGAPACARSQAADPPPARRPDRELSR